MSFGNKLKELRKTHNLTQEAMCHKLHMEQSTYSKYENNKIIPTSDIIGRVSEEFKISADWLLQTEGTQVTFQQGSINNGSTGFVQAQHYYAVPKDLMDSVLQQQKILEQLLQKFAEKF